MKPLLWVDVETTGLDPEKDLLLEVALVSTNSEMEEQGRVSRVIHLPGDYALTPKILEMHGGNGLLDECRASTAALEEVETELVEWVRRRFCWGRPMGGSNPWFDRRFLVRHMPRLASLFHYRSFDVNTVSMLLGVPKGSAEVRHRAIDDIERDISFIRESLKKIKDFS